MIRPADAAKAGPFQEFYAASVAKGMKPEMARLTLARGMAAITLLARNKKVHFKHVTPYIPALRISDWLPGTASERVKVGKIMAPLPTAKWGLTLIQRNIKLVFLQNYRCQSSVLRDKGEK